MNDHTTRKHRLGNARYYRRANARAACILVALIIVLITSIAGVQYTKYLDAHYKTHQQEIQEVHDKLMAVQQADHIPMYHITVTQTN